MSRLVVVLQTALSQSNYGIELQADDSERYLGTLRSVLNSPGGRVWHDQMGGADYVSVETRRLLDQTETRQRAIVHSKDGPLDVHRAAEDR